MIKYKINKNKFGTHQQIAKELGIKKEILDVGCCSGYLKSLSPNNFFYGIDLNQNALVYAKKQGYIVTFNIDLNNYKKFKFKKKFDVIIFADVLEHLINPRDVLTYFINKYLKDDGKIIISLPNVANILIR